jgi:hypothetical protein
MINQTKTIAPTNPRPRMVTSVVSEKILVAQAIPIARVSKPEQLRRKRRAGR